MTRRGRSLGGVLVAAVVLLGGGVALFVLGLGGDERLGRVLGIVAVVLAMVCLRILSWVRRAGLLAEIGRDLHIPPPEGGSQSERSG